MSAEPTARSLVEIAVSAGPAIPRRAGSGLPGVFCYHLGPDQQVSIGSLVEVPFGSRLLPGLVVGWSGDEPAFNTRAVARVLGERPVATGIGVELARFISRTYRAPLFECLSLVLPPGFARRLRQAQRDGTWTPPQFRPPRLVPARSADSLPSIELRPEQVAVRDRLVDAFRAAHFEPFLLFGPTGSGKTLVYLDAVAELVSAGRQAILLVSEIALTPELLARYQGRFPGRTVVLHSRLSAAEHYRSWQAVASGEAQVVVGSRSALFAPTARLGMVVLDEEHEWTYKQDASPRYHAREVALELGRLAGVPVVLSSATPDVETAWRARTRELQLLELKRPSAAAPTAGRPSAPPSPRAEIVDLRQELREGNVNIFSRPLIAHLADTLERGEQAILFINRRGAATCVTCRYCGHVVSCRRCDIPLVYHRAGDLLICHRCNRRRTAVERCPGCGASAIRHFGVGTQRVEQELVARFPAARVVRWDRDAGAARSGLAETWDQLRRGEADVLIGTQMVAKALDFPLVTLVGVILADVGLNLPDFRAAERSFQLLTQVAGRAGRAERPGRVLIQTYLPDHYAVQFAASGDYAGFFRREITFRQTHGYPPFGRLVRFVFSGSDEQRCWRESAQLRLLLRDRVETLADPELRLIGPAPCYVERVRGRYRWQIVVRGGDLDRLLDGLVLPPGWILDVDPVSML
jgi:primosomal protein N' (replication factor Y)